MKNLSLTLMGGISMLAFAVPAAAQSEHAGHTGHDAKPAVSAPTCTPDHAAMGHCTLSVKADDHKADHQGAANHGAHQGHGEQDHAAHQAQGPQAGHDMHGAEGAGTAAVTAAICTPEHAAMGHCTLPDKAQDHSAHQTSANPEAGHSDHAATPDAKADDHAAVQAGNAACTAEHAAMGHCTLEVTNPNLPQIGTNLPAGDAPAPPPPSDWMADAVWGEGAMAHSRHMMMVENGGQTFSYLRLNGEYSARKGRDGYSVDGKFWYGGDINRLHIRGGFSGDVGKGVDDGDIAVLYSRAIDAYFNIEGGIKQELGEGPKRTYASIGFSGLAPYWFELESALMVSDKGDFTAHIEAEYDQLITQKLVLQPAFELGLSAQNVAEKGLGSGITEVGASLRLRYEFVRAFAPYVGVSWNQKIGGTADFVRAAGEKASSTKFVFGLRTWF